MTARDYVLFAPNERVDLPDFRAVQTNARSDTRNTLYGFLLGDTGTTEKRIVSGFVVTEDSGGPSTLVEVTKGYAVGADILEDLSVEYGVGYGLEGQAMQTVDFTGQPTATYGIYVRFSHDPGVIGNRIFWNAATSKEDVDTIETREVIDWDVQFAASSPGPEWHKVADVVWDGASIDNADISQTRQFLFEGLEPTFASGWGTGTDRNTDRGTYGVQDFQTWCNAVREQLDGIIGGTNGWYDAPTADLAEARSHIDLTTDAHSASPTWTGTVTLSGTSTLDINGDLDQTGQILGDWTIGTYPQFGSPGTVQRKWLFSDLKWDPTDTTSPKHSYGPSATDARFVEWAAGNGNGPDLMLAIPSLINTAHGDAVVSIITVYWNHPTAAAAASSTNRVNYRVEKRTASAVQGAWTTVGTSSYFTGGGDYSASDPVDVGNISVSSTPGTSEDWRLVLNLQGDAAGNSPRVYGGLVTYTIARLSGA